MNFHGHFTSSSCKVLRPKQSGWQLSPGVQVLCFGSLSTSLPGLNEATHRWRGCATTLLPGRWADI